MNADDKPSDIEDALLKDNNDKPSFFDELIQEIWDNRFCLCSFFGSFFVTYYTLEYFDFPKCFTGSNNDKILV